MRSGVVTFVAFGLFACAGCQFQVQYKPLTEYTCADGNFKILMPGEPRWSSRLAGFSTFHLAEAFNPDLEFALGYGEFQNGTPTSADLPKIYKAMKEHVLAEYKGTLLYEFTCTTDGCPGLEFGMKLPGDKEREKIGKMRALTNGRMLYFYGVVGNRITANSPEARQYFDSFKLINKPTGAVA